MTFTPGPISFSDLGTHIDALINEMEKRTADILPQPEVIKTTIKNTIPKFSGDFNVDIYENENDLVILCDLPGLEKDQVSVRLIDETTLTIKTKAAAENKNINSTCHLHERKTDAGKRTVRLPAEVTADGAHATFKNGIMEIHLPKTTEDTGTTIHIE